MSSEVVSPAIPLSVPSLDGNEIRYLQECIQTGWISSAGPFVKRFERDFAVAVEARHAVATVNGTSALHVALLLAGVRPDDLVLVPALTFIAPANAVRYAGASPVFVDADRETFQWRVDDVVRYIERDCAPADGMVRDRRTGRRIGAFLPVHLLGHPTDMAPLVELSERTGIPIVEDATESLGGYYHSVHVGSFGLLGCFSFNGNKLLSTGGGGMIVTGSEPLADRARYLTTQAKNDDVEYIHEEIGFNYRLSNLHAAIGVAQLERLKASLQAKRRIADRYAAGLHGIRGIQVPREADDARSAFWLYTIQIDPAEYGVDSRELLRLLAGEAIESRPLWRPMPMLRPHRDAAVLGYADAEWIYRRSLSLPSSVSLSEGDQDRVIQAIQRRRAS